VRESRPGLLSAGSATRRSFITGALVGTAAGALSGRLPGAGAAIDDDGLLRPAPSGAYRIDLHSHFIPPAYSAHLVSHGSITFPWSAVAHLAFMDTWGIEKSVVSAPIEFHFGDAAETRAVARGVNEYGRRLLDEHGDRFAIHVTLPLPDVAGAIDELNYAVDKLGLDGGVMLFSHYEGVYLGDPKYNDLYAEIERRGLVAWVHPTLPVEEPVGPYRGGVLEYPFDTTRAATDLIYRGVLDRYPNIKWQLSHAGGTLPYVLHRLAFVQQQNLAYLGTPPRPQGPFADAKKLYYDTGLAGSEEQLLSVNHLTGVPKIVFGTDYPFTEPAMFLPTSRLAAPWWEDLPKDGDPQPALSRVFTRAERIAIERSNAQQLYPGLLRTS